MSSMSLQKLKTHIQSKNMALGDTQSGADWCLKALHPADPIVEVRGIPDRSAVPSVLMNYQSVFTLAPPVGATDTWSFNMQMIPHPITFLSYIGTSSLGPMSGTFRNTQLAGSASPWEAYYILSRSIATRWRLAYMSTTVYQDGPDLANQGTIAVCQKPVQFHRFSTPNIVTGAGYTPTSAGGFHDTLAYETRDLPNFDVTQAMPNAYFGRSKEGAYIPLKLTKTSQKWFSATDGIRIVDDANLISGPNGTTCQFAPGLPGANIYPFYGLNETTLNPTNPPSGLLGQDYCPPMNDFWADICVSGAAVTTTFKFFVRVGIEMQVEPRSELGPHLKLSPPHDPRALNAYFAIARELKDAYPADYNDLGKIWDVISKALKWVSPALVAIPEFGPVIAGATTGIAALGDTISAAVSKRKAKRQQKALNRDLASAAEIEHLRERSKTDQAIIQSNIETAAKQLQDRLKRAQPRRPRSNLVIVRPKP